MLEREEIPVGTRVWVRGYGRGTVRSVRRVPLAHPRGWRVDSYDVVLDYGWLSRGQGVAVVEPLSVVELLGELVAAPEETRSHDPTAGPF